MNLYKKLRYLWHLAVTRQKPLRYVASRTLWRTRACRFVTIPRHDYVIRFHPTQLSANLWLDSGDRASDEDFFRRYLRPGASVVDVGANIGNLTLVAARAVGPTGVVYAIEPQTRIYEYLVSNVHLNGFAQVNTFCIAVGPEPAAVSITSGRSDTENRVQHSIAGERVRQERLDDLLKDVRAVELLKVDVEGYELPVLKGAERTLRRTKCVYYETSVISAAQYGYRPRDVNILLSGAGFSLFRLIDEQVVHASIDYAPTIAENLIAVRDVEEFLDRTAYRLGRDVVNS